MPFIYEGLPIFYFGCGKLGHGIKECETTPKEEKSLPKDAFPYFVALKTETNIRGRECQDLVEHKMARPITVKKVDNEMVASLVS